MTIIKIKISDMVFGKYYTFYAYGEVHKGIFDDYYQEAPVLHFGNGGFYSLYGKDYLEIVK